MRAACCEATVLRNEVIAPDIRLLTVVWPDRDHAPHAGQFFTLRAWGADCLLYTSPSPRDRS